MNTFTTYRQGRRIYTPGEKRASSCCDKIFSFLFTFLFITFPPVLFYFTEQQRFYVYSSLAETIDKDILELSSLSPTKPFKHHHLPTPTSKFIVHGKPTNINSSTSDPEMGIRIHNSLHLSRKTEYCQWEEVRKESCETCTRTKQTTKPETGEKESYTETYDCNCVTTFDYIKGWRSYRINSMVFDQPAAHYNPQRDPFPSKDFVSNDVVMEFRGTSNHKNNDEEDQEVYHQRQHHESFDGHNKASKLKNDEVKPFIATLSPSMLHNGIRGAKARTIKWVRDGIPPIPSFWRKWIPDKSRYEDTYHLHQYPLSDYSIESNFVYVGDGWFFSPYESSRQEKMFKYFMQYIEGTIFDWQIGDLMPSCEAGDIRVQYTVQDPQVVSILGELTKTGTSAKNVPQYTIKPIQTKNGRSVGLVHEGFHSAQDMIVAEDQDSIFKAAICRCLLLLWAFGVGRYLGSNMFGVDLARAAVPTQIASTLCIWSAICSSLWVLFWGIQVDGFTLIIATLLFAMFVCWFPPPQRKLTHDQYKAKFT